MEELANHTSRIQSFDDFLSYALIIMNRYAKTEVENYLPIIMKYPPGYKQHVFDRALIAIGSIADNNGKGLKDPFYDYYKVYIATGRQAHLLQSEFLCDMQVRQTFLQPVIDNCAVYNRGGTGQYFLSAAKYNRNVFCVGFETDLTCFKMTVLNLMLNVLQGSITYFNNKEPHVAQTYVLSRTTAFKHITVPVYTRTQECPAEYAEKCTITCLVMCN